MYFQFSSHTGYLCTSRDTRLTNHDRAMNNLGCMDYGLLRFLTFNNCKKLSLR